MTSAVVHVTRFQELDPRTAYLLWQLRESVFVVEQRCAYPELDGRDIEPETLHVWVQEEATPIAYLRIIEDGSGPVRIGRVLVAAAARGRGLAETIMRRAIEEIGAQESVLSAQSHLADWYRKFGYQQTGPEFLDDGIPHIPMRRPG